MRRCAAAITVGLVGLLVWPVLSAARPADSGVGRYGVGRYGGGGYGPEPRQEVPEPPARAGETAGPILVISSTEWNFGRKWHGEPCSTEITIGNVGDAPLKIINIRSSCGCMVAQPKKRELLPGESDTMTLTYNTKKTTRQVAQTIMLETNDPRQPRVTIKISGEVRYVYEAEPAHRVAFSHVERDTTATQKVELSNNMDQDVFLKLKPISDSDPFEVKLEEIKPGRAYRLVVTTRPPLNIGANTANVVLETGLPEHPSLTIPVSAYIAPRVAVFPPRLYVAPQVMERFRQTVRVSYRPDSPLKITEIKSSHPELIRAELLPPERVGTKAPGVYEIEVSLPPAKEFPAGGAKLEIYTDDPAPEYQKLVVEIKMRESRARHAGPESQQGEPSATDEPEGEPSPEPAP